MEKLEKFLFSFLMASLALMLIQCKDKVAKTNDSKTSKDVETKAMVSIEKKAFGITEDGQSVEKYTLKNSKGMVVDIITYGGIIANWSAPDKEGKYQDIVLGYNTLDQYLKSTPYFGALIGRYGNRIAKGKFSLDGKKYQVTVNDGQNSLHGGDKGFDKVVWKAEELPNDNKASLKLTYTSVDGEEGYPGNLAVTVIYTLTDDNALEVDYNATTNMKTIVNLTQHSYFNLPGDFSKSILDEEIMINADRFLPVDATLIPTGELKPVEGTPFDFRTAKTIGKEINEENDQLKKGKGYDHCWILNDQDKDIHLAATAYDPGSGRFLEILTDQPGIQFYTGNFLDGTLPAKNGGTYGHRTGFCLETQHYPDSPNQSDFPSVVLNPGDTYKTKTIFKFSAK